MPLLDENRVFVKFGLETLQRTNKAGLKALIRSAGLAEGKLRTDTLGFVLGPRINAIGRLDAAAHALQLMLTADGAEAQRLAELLERTNQDRQATQSRIFEEAATLARALDPVQNRVLVLASDQWHSGVIGVVANKLVEAFARPAILIALDRESGRGSARSIRGVNIFEAIGACRALLVRCGGHEAAAGFEIARDKIDEFRRAICRVVEERADEELFAPRLQLDAYLDPGDLDMALARDLECMEPFGHGNPAPVFATRAMRVAEVQTLMPRQPYGVPHLKLRLCGDGGRSVQAVFWRNGHIAAELARDAPLDVCYALKIDDYRGYQSLQLDLKDLRITQHAL
jgi:single-stranded-DNA-specific exonuclease